MKLCLDGEGGKDLAESTERLNGLRFKVNSEMQVARGTNPILHKTGLSKGNFLKTYSFAFDLKIIFFKKETKQFEKFYRKCMQVDNIILCEFNVTSIKFD